MTDIKKFEMMLNPIFKNCMDDLYCSQLRDGYSWGYLPKYPKYSKDDVNIWISDMHNEYNYTHNNITYNFNCIVDLLNALKNLIQDNVIFLTNM